MMASLTISTISSMRWPIFSNKFKDRLPMPRKSRKSCVGWRPSVTTTPWEVKMSSKKLWCLRMDQSPKIRWAIWISMKSGVEVDQIFLSLLGHRWSSCRPGVEPQALICSIWTYQWSIRISLCKNLSLKILWMTSPQRTSADSRRKIGFRPKIPLKFLQTKGT